MLQASHWPTQVKNLHTDCNGKTRLKLISKKLKARLAIISFSKNNYYIHKEAPRSTMTNANKDHSKDIPPGFAQQG